MMPLYENNAERGEGQSFAHFAKKKLQTTDPI